ncbi:MAG: hypothetical protein K6G24_11265 [Lachnospiraceae bacterium]|nr:hypothetical protein [Lachnospiraceae bacterium]
MTNKDRIDSLKQELSEAYEQINNLKKKANDDFSASSEYTRMQQEIKGLKLMQSIEEKHLESKIKHDKDLLQQIMKIRKDNVALCREHGIEYWEGLTQTDRYSDIHELENKVANLEAKIVAKNIVIEHLKDLLSGRDPLAPKETVMGRKPIPDEQKERIKSYRRQGYTLKEISTMEGVSLGAVSGICKDIKFHT